MGARYPRGYRRADEKYQDFIDYEQYNKFNPLKIDIPKDSIIKFHGGILAELKDPIRKSEQVISKEEIFDLRLDIYLFGKGDDINS